MTDKELNFVISLKKGLRLNFYVYVVVAIASFLNVYFQFTPELNAVSSFIMGVGFCYVSLSNYLGDTQLHKCSEIIDNLVNRDPELIKRLSNIKEEKSTS